jgi:hypothetical protein
MSIVLDGTAGITTNSGTVVSTTDATLNGLTVGKGGGSEAGSTTVGGSSLGGGSTNTGTDNSAFGFGTLYVNTSGSSNSGFGRGAMRYNTTGGSNSAFGYQALNNNTTASNNTAVGYQAGYNTNNADNVAIGYQAGYAGGPENVSVGSKAGFTSNGGYNVFVGRNAGNQSSGSGNCFVGWAAGTASTGSSNTFVGGNGTNTCGYAMTTGNGNTILGAFSGNNGGLDIRTATNNIVLSDGTGNPRLHLDSNGSFQVPQTYNDTTGSGANLFISSAGYFYRSTSSLKYKKNVADATHGLTDLLKLRSVTYQGKSETDDGKTFGGLIAEEVHEAGLTEFVQYSDDGSPDALAYGNMVSLLVKSIQELKTIVDAQAAEIAELKAKVNV